MKTEQDFEDFEKSERQLHVFYRELSALSKKNSNDAVNRFKLALINECLRELNEAIGSPLKGFDSFDESLLPSNSDVALVLGQYVAAVFAFRVTNTSRLPSSGEWFWMNKGRPALKTDQPYSFKYSEK